MKEEKPFEPVPRIRPGDEVLRRKRRPRRRLRIAPNVPGFIRFLRSIITQTPFLQMISLLLILWLLFSAGVYFAESGAEGSTIHSYGRALYWGIAAFSTAGIADTPLTAVGQVIGGIWIVLGSLIFFGTIVAVVTTYFMRPPQRPTPQIIATIQYNLEQLEKLSVEELEVLKETTDGLINIQIGRLKERSSG